MKKSIEDVKREIHVLQGEADILSQQALKEESANGHSIEAMALTVQKGMKLAKVDALRWVLSDPEVTAL